jgi:predicted O-methyltransferase YrrM
MDIGVPVGTSKMTPIVPKSLEDYCAAHTTSPDPLLDELAAYTHAHCKDPQMLTGPVEGTLLRMLVQLSGARRVLEIGTYTGYSALSMAAGLPDGGELITCDSNPETTGIAQSFWARSLHGGRIKPILGPALETISALPAETRFDFVFIDAPTRKTTCATTRRCYHTSGPAACWLPTTPSGPARCLRRRKSLTTRSSRSTPT